MATENLKFNDKTQK